MRLTCEGCGEKFEHMILHRDNSKKKRFCDPCLRYPSRRIKLRREEPAYASSQMSR